MSKMLGVLFSDSDAAALSGFAAICGLEAAYVSVQDAVADALAEAIAQQAQGATHIVAVSCMASKDAMARVAGLLDCGMITDAISADSATSFKRPIVAGTIIATVEIVEGPTVLTIRPSGFAKQGSTSVSAPPLSAGAGKAQVTHKSTSSGARPDLTQAKMIVSGGRPLKDAETFERVIGGFADAFGAAVGATRAAVDSGIAPNELQVGQTGKIVAPDLYIAAGISGSTQHMAGIKDSKLIVAINKDPDAPIFEFADLGIVADLYDALPALQAELKK